MSRELYLTALGSGSSGNAFAVHCGSDVILVDAGFSCKELKKRLTVSGIDPENVRAVLLTHEHSDHLSGCRVFCDTFQIPLYAAGQVADRLARQEKALPARVFEFEPGSTFPVAGFEISPFPVQHDAVDPVGFVIARGSARIGMATDLGKINALARARLKNCDALVLESNYDLTMLMNSQRRLQLKRRINGEFGHLDNRAAAAALEELIGDRTRAVVLVHVSSECNTYDLVKNTGMEVLQKLRRHDILLEVARQHEPLSSFSLIC
ncbi:MAG: MBL fold metallo-hydrolase [Lentisphaeria bacterium]|nr:MBL fold metallo-hydrolase [Lentisphaeria bacterium]